MGNGMDGGTQTSKLGFSPPVRDISRLGYGVWGSFQEEVGCEDRKPSREDDGPGENS